MYACNKLISESIGMLPMTMMQYKDGATRVAQEKPMYRMLHDGSDDLTAKTFKETLTSNRMLGGMAYGQILRRSGTGVAIEVVPILPENVKPTREKSGQKRQVFEVKEPGAPNVTYTVERGKPHDLLVLRGLGWDGLTGYSVVQLGAQSIGTAQAAERNAANFWSSGGRVPYNLELAKDWKTKEDGEQFRSDWERTYSVPGRAPIIPPGIKYQQTGLSMVDAQALETRLFDIHEICRWFLVSPHMVGDLSRATFSNIEQLALEFVKMTLHTHITCWEQELWRCALTPQEKDQGFFFKFNVNALLRGDFQTRMAGYSTMLQNGIANIDEVRELEDLNPLPNGAGQAHHIQLNQATVPGSGGPNGRIIDLQEIGTIKSRAWDGIPERYEIGVPDGLSSRRMHDSE